jgi:hypothetical protein
MHSDALQFLTTITGGIPLLENKGETAANQITSNFDPIHANIGRHGYSERLPSELVLERFN